MIFKHLLFNTNSTLRFIARRTISSNNHISNVRISESKNHPVVELQFEKNAIKVPLVWFRDHCRNPLLYNSTTNQRLSNCTNLLKKATIDSPNSIQFNEKDQKLKISWSDGHNSVFTTEQIFNWTMPQDRTQCISTILWDNTTLKELPTVSYRNFDYTKFSQLFLQFGIVGVAGIDQINKETTKKFCESLGPLHESMFGNFWVFGNEINETPIIADTSFGNGYIGPHNDGTYSDNTPGIQVFQCLKAADEGGYTLLVDGFSAAERLRKEFAKAFSILSTVPVEHQFLQGLSATKENGSSQPETKIFARAIHPVIKLFNNKLIQIRFNPYDRSPMNCIDPKYNDEQNIENTIDFYEAYEAFSKIIHSEKQIFSLSLRPDLILFVDNYRVFHARTAFKGDRILCGCYMSHDGLLARARPYLFPTLHTYV